MSTSGLSDLGHAALRVRVDQRLGAGAGQAWPEEPRGRAPRSSRPRRRPAGRSTAGGGRVRAACAAAGRTGRAAAPRRARRRHEQQRQDDPWWSAPRAATKTNSTPPGTSASPRASGIEGEGVRVQDDERRADHRQQRPAPDVLHRATAVWNCSRTRLRSAKAMSHVSRRREDGGEGRRVRQPGDVHTDGDGGDRHGRRRQARAAGATAATGRGPRCTMTATSATNTQSPKTRANPKAATTEYRARPRVAAMSGSRRSPNVARHRADAPSAARTRSTVAVAAGEQLQPSRNAPRCGRRRPGSTCAAARRW